MNRNPKAGAFLLVLCSVLTTSLQLAAHQVTVDGNATEWSSRLPNADNLGIIVRDAAGAGSFVWRDAQADTRTDIATPEVVADVRAFQVTGSTAGIGFLIRRIQGATLTGAPIQVQIAIDVDRVAGSGQEFLAEFADTKVSDNARWEFLVETLFGTGGNARVIDKNFNQVASVQAVQGPAGDIEILVPWSALGMSAPPVTPLRFTMATFRCQANADLTIDIGGPNFSNALDVMSDYGDPAAASYPNTYTDVQDQVVNYWVDLWFDTKGEVYSPVLIVRALPNSSGAGPDEWYTLKNVTPGQLALEGYKLGDEETPDGTEGMFLFPAAAVVAAGTDFTVVRALGAFQAFYGKLPFAELPPGGSAGVADMSAYLPWTGGVAGTMQLSNAGDELLLLSASNTILDVLVFGNGAYSGIAAASVPASDKAIGRQQAVDTDDCQADFTVTSDICSADVQCGGVCWQCAEFVCGPKPLGAPCPDALLCNGEEACDGAGVCAEAAPLVCDDGNVCNGQETCSPASGCTTVSPPLDCNDNRSCTNDSCDPIQGCLHDDSACECNVDEDCSDSDLCTGQEACEWDTGLCLDGAPLTCLDMDICNGTETCDPVAGCQGGAPLNCDDGYLCTIDSCVSPVGCLHDHTACTCWEDADCEDMNPCTTDFCDPNVGCIRDALPDSDGDNICDWVDNCPNDINQDQQDSDGDGIGDVCEPVEPNPEEVEPNPEAVEPNPEAEDLVTQDMATDWVEDLVPEEVQADAVQPDTTLPPDASDAADDLAAETVTPLDSVDDDLPIPPQDQYEQDVNQPTGDTLADGPAWDTKPGSDVLGGEDANSGDIKADDDTNAGGGGSKGGCAAQPTKQQTSSPAWMVVAALAALALARRRIRG